MVFYSETKVLGTPNTNASKLVTSAKTEQFYGLNFPLGSTVKAGYFSKLSGIQLVKKNLIQLIRTDRGERFMLPLFGTNLKKYLFEPKDAFLYKKIRTEIAETIQRYAPYVELIRVEVLPTSKSQYTGGIEIKLFCKIREEDGVVFEVNLGII